MNHQTRGFTLIELLVVIAIISILASIVLVALGSARAKARDINRVANANQLRTMLEFYINDHGSYPGVADTWYINGCDTTGYGTYADIDTLIGAYGQVPRDPSGDGCIWYMRAPGVEYTTMHPYQYAILITPELQSTISLGQGCYSAGYYCVGQL